MLEIIGGMLGIALLLSFPAGRTVLTFTVVVGIVIIFLAILT